MKTKNLKDIPIGIRAEKGCCRCNFRSQTFWQFYSYLAGWKSSKNNFPKDGFRIDSKRKDDLFK